MGLLNKERMSMSGWATITLETGQKGRGKKVFLPKDSAEVGNLVMPHRNEVENSPTKERRSISERKASALQKDKA